jgi:hypothetical protein
MNGFFGKKSFISIFKYTYCTLKENLTCRGITSVQHGRQYHELLSIKRLEDIKEDYIIHNSSMNICYPDESSKQLWRPEEVEKIELLNHIDEWSYPIFRLYDISSQNILSHVNEKPC